MKKNRIGLMGLTSSSVNKGCEALTYSFLEMMKQYTEEEYTFYFIERLNFSELKTFKLLKRLKEEKKNFKKFGVKVKHIFYRPAFKRIIFTPNLYKVDICIDFTQGDSFTDIYGDDRFNDWTLVKEAIILNKIPLVLGSQTIGPFNKDENRKRAATLINNCKAIFARDINSYNYVKEISNKTPILTTDVAFFLPYDDDGYKKSKKLGFNPSGLLWNGGYTSDNQFGLSIDYQEFCRRCIQIATEKGYEVHLIGHVVDKNLEQKDNDCVATKALHELFPQTILAPMFNTPMEAKTYISKMGAFSGARMHATIASMSSGVPVLPFSYSRKFEGLFNTLEYTSIIHGKKDNLEVSIKKFEDFIKNIDLERKNILRSQTIIDKMKKDMLKEYKRLFE